MLTSFYFLQLGGSKRQIVEPVPSQHGVRSIDKNIIGDSALKLPIDGDPRVVEDLKNKLFSIFLAQDVL